jgi:hypothetical protein
LEAARTSETLVNFYQTTRCYNPEDSLLLTHRRENLKSYLEKKHIKFYKSVPVLSHGSEAWTVKKEHMTRDQATRMKFVPVNM